MIKFDEDPYSSMMNSGTSANVPPHVASLVSTIQHANQMLTASGYSVLPNGSLVDGATRSGSSANPPLPPLPLPDTPFLRFHLQPRVQDTFCTLHGVLVR